MKFQITFFLLWFCFTSGLFAQKTISPASATPVDKSAIQIRTDHRQNIPAQSPSIFDIQNVRFDQPIHFHKPTKEPKLQFSKDKTSGLPIMISGILENPNRNADSPTKCFEYLDAVKSVIQIENPTAEFAIKKTSTDQRSVQHIRMDQYFNGIKVHGGEIVLHKKNEDIFLFNGRYYPTPELETTLPAIAQTNAEEIVKADHGNWQELDIDQRFFIAHEQLKTELVIYHENKALDQEKLTWHIIAIPNIMERWEYFIDATTGAVLHKFKNVCEFHGAHCAHETEHEAPVSRTVDAEHKKENSKAAFFGPETAVATDLLGINRNINVYETGGTYYLIDASRTMFNNSLSNFPNNPSGVIWSIDAFDTSPENSDFNYDHVSSNNNSWNNPTSVSAHYNGGIAYEYFKNTFGRESINGQGGNIVSIINVSEADGNSMDNAFWNGAAMFYGNGDQVFNAPLAKALDVAGHEMSHGVVQSEANLEYQFESGAMNESFADIFGAMIDRDDWNIGEEIANPSFFPSGTMRSMSDPNNGGNSSNFYWQPKHVNEMYIGNQDNGGVHINSGIPNYAFYLFASQIGKDDAEDIYYDVLTNYLVASSQFVDLRFAVVQSATQMFGANSSQVNAANDAFNAVGIGEGGGNDYQEDIEVNPGDNFVLWSDLQLSTINNANTDGSSAGLLSNTDHISKPSVTDDGSIILFIDSNNAMKEINIDWSTGEIINEYIIEDGLSWRNVATSKDGSKLAAITTDNNNEVFIFDFNSMTSQWYELYNPTTAEGVSTGDVQYLDVLEWDVTGEFVMYDALNQIQGQGSTIEYWDVGFLRVWDNSANNFGDGFVSKLFTGLPDNVSIGNPTFSKNSPYIIAFDYIESTTSGTEYAVLGANTQTGDEGLIFENNKLGYPSYSTSDQEIIFSLVNGSDDIIGIRALAEDKISGTGDAFIFLENAEWGVWYATGERNLTSTDEFEQELGLSVYPNPVDEMLNIEWKSDQYGELQLELLDMTGRLMMSQQIIGRKSVLNMNNFTPGAYVLRITGADGMMVRKVVKN